MSNSRMCQYRFHVKLAVSARDAAKYLGIDDGYERCSQGVGEWLAMGWEGLRWFHVKQRNGKEERVTVSRV